MFDWPKPLILIGHRNKVNNFILLNLIIILPQLKYKSKPFGNFILPNLFIILSQLKE